MQEKEPFVLHQLRSRALIVNPAAHDTLYCGSCDKIKADKTQEYLISHETGLSFGRTVAFVRIY